MDTQEIGKEIEAGLQGSIVHIQGDGRHFFADVICDQFHNLSKINRHKLVYATLKGKVGGAIHALSVHAYTQEEWEKKHD